MKWKIKVVFLLPAKFVIFFESTNPKSDHSYPSCPFSAGDSLTIENFGQIYDGEGYCRRLTAYPVGFRNERKFRLTESNRCSQIIRSEINDSLIFDVILLGKKEEKVFSREVSSSDAWTKEMGKTYRSERIDPRMTKLSASQHF